MPGPLEGVTVLELAGIGPGPWCCMMLADQGAEVIRVEPPGGAAGPPIPPKFDVLNRGRKNIRVDLRSPEGKEVVLRLLEKCDALVEGFRPGVTEKLGLGPDVCLARNPKLVYGRITGWGQNGPYAQAAGHDLNYISISGALAAIGPKDQKPAVPLNLVGDFGGGGMLMAFGIATGIVHAKNGGKGQVVDAAMVDGSAVQMAMMYGMYAAGAWQLKRGMNTLDGGAHFYDTYETKDGQYVSIGPIEPKFYQELLKLTGSSMDEKLKDQGPPWPEKKDTMAALFKTKTRDEWCDLMEASDACFSPVLDMREAPLHPHNIARESFVDIGGVVQPAPAPRFLGTPASRPSAPPKPGQHTREVLERYGFSGAEVGGLLEKGVVLEAKTKSKL